MAYMDDYDSGYPTRSASIGDALKLNIANKVGTDTERGTVTIVGKEISVGREAAVALNGLIAQAQNWISNSGAAYARKYGMQVAEWVAPKHAGRAGNAAELAWRFGFPVLDVAGGVKHAVAEGYQRMHGLSQEASAVLAANDGVKSKMGGVLGTNFSALAYERSLVFKESRKTIQASLTSVIKNMPSVIINIWNYKRQQLVSSGAGAEASEAAAEHAAAALEGASASAAAASPAALKGSIARILNPKTVEDIDENLKYSQWMPAIGGLMGEIASSHIEKNVGTQASAWRNIKVLENVIKEQEPSSGGDIESYVRDVFQQHVYDSGKKHLLAGAKYNHIIEAVSEALVHGGLHPQALVELLDDKKVIAFHGEEVTYGKPMAIKEELAKLTEKYTAKVSQKEFYNDAPFTKEQAAQAFRALSEEEKPLYVMLFPPGVLEGAGIKKEEVAKYRELGKQSLVDDVTTAVSNLLQTGQETLRKQGVKPDQIAELEAIEGDFRKAMQYNRATEYVADNLEDTKALVRNIAASAKKPGQLWSEVISPRETADMSPQAMTRKGPLEHALRESSDAREIG